MELRFLGTGGAFFPTMGNNCACFVQDKRLYLIDCGEDVFGKLFRSGLLTQHEGALTVVVTHLHGDHCGSLATLILYATSVLHRSVTVVHPNEEIRMLLRLMGVEASQYRLVDALNQEGLSITAVPVRHAPQVKAYAYWLRDAQGTVYYSGDNGDLPDALLDALEAGTVQRIYQDTHLFGRAPQQPTHLPYETLCQRVKPLLRSRITLMHFNEDFRARARADGFACAEIDPVFLAR